jgi:hypothetical protein
VPTSGALELNLLSLIRLHGVIFRVIKYMDYFTSSSFTALIIYMVLQCIIRIRLIKGEPYGRNLNCHPVVLLQTLEKIAEICMKSVCFIFVVHLKRDSALVHYPKHNYNDQVKEDKICRACSSYGGEKRNAYRILIGKPEGKRPL